MGACGFYRRHIHNFTYSSAPLTHPIKKTTPWRWTAREEKYFQELKKKIASLNCLGVPRPKGEIVLITDASDVGGGGTIYQWQELNPAELTHCHYRTTGLNRDGSLKHGYPTSEWRLVPIGDWNRKWNQARSNYSTYDQEHLAGMLVLSSQSRLLKSTPILWLCDQEPVNSFQKGPPPEKAKLKRRWTYLSTLHHRHRRQQLAPPGLAQRPRPLALPPAQPAAATAPAPTQAAAQVRAQTADERNSGGKLGPPTHAPPTIRRDGGARATSRGREGRDNERGGEPTAPQPANR